MTLKRLIKRLEVQKKDQRKKRKMIRNQRNGKTSRRRMFIQSIKNMHHQEVKKKIPQKMETTTSTACIKAITLIQRTAISQERMYMVTNMTQRSSQQTQALDSLLLPLLDH
jgi:hypothetical protein